MKILHIINNLGSGGAEKLLKELTPLMNQVGDLEVDILLLTDKNNVFYDSLITQGVKVNIVKYKNIYDPRNIFEVKKYIFRGNYNIVHSHTFPAQYWVALTRPLIKKKNIKFITTEHSTHNKRREKSYFRPIEKFIYSNYDAIISISEKTKENLINWIDPKRKKVDKHVVIENGVDVEKIKQASPYSKTDLVESIDDNTKLVCMVGRFSEAKDQPTLIKAISTLPDDVHLLLVGEGPLLDQNKEFANQLGITDRVHFLGFRKDIPEILKTVDIVVLSSHWEGFGLTAVEGMAARKPVVTSNIPGLADVVKEAGRLFENEDELKDIINILLENHVLYEKIAKICINKAETYDIRKQLRMLLKIY
ncbi:glycosyltransferase [Chungangia koreensis]|uniref:glycosyltransferase n=1 Tax=Chungangia koreensis TaxID=752657 RepID=UPI00366C6FCB